MAQTDSIRENRLPGTIVDSLIRKLLYSDSEIQNILLLGADVSTIRSMLGIAEKFFQPTIAASAQRMRIHVLEHSRPIIDKTRSAVMQRANLIFYNYYPIAKEDIYTSAQISAYYQTKKSRSKYITLQEAKKFLVDETGISVSLYDEGVTKILVDDGNIAQFDFIIFDGAWFTGDKLASFVPDAKYVLLYDINTIKNGELYLTIVANNTHDRIAIHKTTAIDDEWNGGMGVALFKLKTP